MPSVPDAQYAGARRLVHGREWVYVLVLGDVALLLLCTALAVFLRFGAHVNFFVEYTGATTFSILVLVGVFYIADLYNIAGWDLRSERYRIRVAMAVVVVGLLQAAVFYAFPFWKWGRGTFLYQVALMAVTMPAWRWMYGNYIGGIQQDRVRRILIVGAGGAGQFLIQALRALQPPGIRIVGFIDDNPNLAGQDVDGTPVLGGHDALSDIIEANRVDQVILAITHAKRADLLRTLLAWHQRGVPVVSMPRFYEHLTGKIPIWHIEDSWFLYTEGFDEVHDPLANRMRRIFDMGIASVGLILSAPLWPVIAALIKVSSRGPILFRQLRVGKNEVEYQLLKFRTMYHNAEAESGPVWAEHRDPRVTRIGRVLRRTRLDEIPQLINVLRGEMSVIGPRPERRFFIDQLKQEIPYYSLRFSVKPGLTGWAQVNYPYGASVRDAIEKLQYELYYIKNQSLLIDCQILLRTIAVVLFSRGS